VTIELHNTGNPELRAEIPAVVEHVLSSGPGVWCLSIIGTQANDEWQMKITGPNAFERSYILEGSMGEHRPD
jgi:hypothetical protein